MKKQLVLRQYLLVIACIFLSYVTYSQESDHFKMVDIPTRVLKIDQVFTSDDQLPLDQMKAPISGLAISGEISFNSDSSLVRVILIDKQNDEYLVFETYPFLAEAVSFTITGWCEETARLSNVTAQALRLEIIDASFQLNEILISERPSATGFRTMDKSEDQRAAKIAKLNESIKERGNYWRAGETSVSRLSYQEKKQLFGNKIPNLQGFDYYVGGVFVIPGALEAPVEESPFVEEFSWRKRHGQDWSTAVKNQGFCGSCWAFGAVGATELMVNLYYNRHINIDLSEQEVLSCSNAGSCSGGFSGGALNYIREHGISNEQCYPYAALDLPCANKCNTPTEKIQIENYQYHPSSDMQRFIFQKPAAFGISSWGHCITLMGFKVLEEGDRVAEDFSIPSGDPIIGRLAWEIKNSWGSGWGEGGFGYVLTVPDNIGSSYSISGKVTSMNYNDNDIVCEDKDGDGYYNWGIGEKPAHCLTCPDEPDGDDASPYLGPMDEYGIMKVNIPFVTVNAKGTEAGGVFAHYKVYLNDELVGDTYASANYKADTFAIPSSIGEIEKLTVVFDNDALILGEDRNLSVKNVSINQNKIAASNKNVVYKRKTGEIIPFDELMPWEGELIFDLKEIYSKIIVSAKGSQADGEFAHFKVYVDGTEIANEYTSSTYKSYQFTLLVNSNNIDEIKISFDNDALDNGNDRNLYVQSIGLNGEIIEATAENVTYKRTTGEVIPYNGVMPWNGDLIFEFAPAICKGDITLSSQAEVDAFNCEAVTGTLTISGSDITNVDSLSELKSV
ncbi:MAG: carbohydrate-binding domain-containing protein, partial [Bacteroidota bacterium]